MARCQPIPNRNKWAVTVESSVFDCAGVVVSQISTAQRVQSVIKGDTAWQFMQRLDQRAA
jgi:hypothetical protein